MTRTFKPVEIYTVIAIVYLLMTTVISMGVTFLESRWRIQLRSDGVRTRPARGVARAGIP